MKLSGRFYATVAVVGAVIVGALLPSFLGPVRAQLNAPQTWAGSAGGSANALALTVPNVVSMADLLGVPVRFLPSTPNLAGLTTVVINSIAVKPVLRVSGGSLVGIAGGDFSTNVMAEIMWDGTEFVQTNPATGTDPVGTEKDFTGASAQIPSGYLVENGICISQSTYAALYASYGSSDLYSPGSTGGACSAGQFHVKYANARASVAADTQGGVTASLLTNAATGCPATTVAVNCGAQNVTLPQSALPNVSPTITIIDPGHHHTMNGSSVLESNNNPAVGSGSIANNATTNNAFTGITATSSSINGGVTQTAVTTYGPLSTVYKLVKY